MRRYWAIEDSWIAKVYPTASTPQKQRVFAFSMLLVVGIVALVGYLVVNVFVGDYYFAAENAIIIVLSVVALFLLRRGRYTEALYVAVFFGGVVVELFIVFAGAFSWSQTMAFGGETLPLTATMYLLIIGILSTERRMVYLSIGAFTLIVTAGTAFIDESTTHLAIFSATNAFLFLLIVSTVTFLLFHLQQHLVTSIREKEVLTERLETEKLAAERANGAKSIFLAKMSHDLRTPISNVLGISELLLRTTDDGETRRFVKSIQHSGKTLLRLVEDILDLSKVEAEEVLFVREEFNLSTVIKTVVRSVTTAIREKGLSLEAHIDIDDALRVAGDPARLEQTITNVLVNAVKYTDSGVIAVRASIDTRSDPYHCTITIADTGIGIPPELLDSIFEPFSQGAPEYYGARRGVGLGLSIVKHVLNHMGGDVAVHSEVGAGTTVTMRFPMDAADGLVEPDPADEIEEGITRSTQAYRVLIADDDPVNRELIIHTLQHLGHSVTACENGSEAVEQFETDAFDMVILDIHMPVLDGIDATASLRSLENFRQNPVPILGLTASAMPQEIECFLAAGMDRVLTKPFTIDELSQAIAAFAIHDTRAFDT